MLLSISARSFAPPAQEYAVDVLEEGSDVSPQKAQVGIGLQSPRDSIWIVWTIPPSGVLAKGLDMSSGRRIRETRLKLHQMEFVVAIYERRSIAAAALALNISQPAATRMLKEIESILGVKLFERTRLGVTPTPYGDAMIRRARLILSETRLLHDEIAALANGVEGRIAVGTLLAASATLLPLSIERLRQRFPKVSVHILEGTFDVLVPMLRTSDLDILLGRLPRLAGDEGIATETLFMSRHPSWRDPVTRWCSETSPCRIFAKRPGYCRRGERCFAPRLMRHFAP